MLAGWRAFPVIARNSTFTYKGKTVDIKKVGEELGVRYVLEGSVRKSGHRVRVTVQLIRADTEPSHHGRAVRSRPDRPVRAAGRDRPHDRRRDRAGTPQIRARAHRRAAAAQRRRLRTLPARHVAPLPAEQGGQHRGAGLFPARAGDRSAISAGDGGAVDRAAATRPISAGPTMPSATIEESYRAGAARGRARPPLPERPLRARSGLHVDAPLRARRSRRSRKRSSSTRALPPPMSCSGRCTSIAGRPEEAIALAEKGIRLSPSDPRLFIWLPALAGAHYQLRHYAAGGRDRAAVLDAQPQLAGRSALCRRRARPARADRGGAGGARRAETAEREPGLCRRQFATAVQRPGRGRSHPRRAAQGRVR